MLRLQLLLKIITLFLNEVYFYAAIRKKRFSALI